MFSKAEIWGASSRIKGVYQAGGGLCFNCGKMQYSLEARYHHFSNGGIEEPNWLKCCSGFAALNVTVNHREVAKLF